MLFEGFHQGCSVHGHRWYQSLIDIFTELSVTIFCHIFDWIRLKIYAVFTVSVKV